MPDAVGYRKKFGVIVPSTNTVVEADYNRMAPHGVTFHTGRMYIGRPVMDSDAAFQAVLEQIRESIGIAIRDVMTCQPDYMIMGMSSETFWGGVAGNARFIERVRTQSGLNVSTGASACRAALERLGVTRIAVLSPYQAIADQQVSCNSERRPLRRGAGAAAPVAARTTADRIPRRQPSRPVRARIGQGIPRRPEGSRRRQSRGPA